MPNSFITTKDGKNIGVKSQLNMLRIEQNKSSFLTDIQGALDRANILTLQKTNVFLIKICLLELSQ